MAVFGLDLIKTLLTFLPVAPLSLKISNQNQVLLTRWIHVVILVCDRTLYDRAN